MQSIIQCEGALASVLCKIWKPDPALDDAKYELMRDLCSLLPNFSTTVEAIEGDFIPILNAALLFWGLPRGHLGKQPNDNSCILLLKENVNNEFDSRFPRDDVMLTAALLDFTDKKGTLVQNG